MAVATGPHIFVDPIITIEATSYKNQLRVAELVPSTDNVTYPTLDPTGTIQASTNTTWVLNLEGIQNTLAKLLRDNAGTELEVVLQPKPGTGQETATFTIIAKPVRFGGTTGEILTFEESFAVVGSPVFDESV